MQLGSHLWLGTEDGAYLGHGRIELLSHIDALGSISQAAKAMKMSYKAAWEAVNEMNRLSPEPIVERATGGRGGGGTVLTERGRELIAIFRRLEEAQHAFAQTLGAYADDWGKLDAFMAKKSVRTSARNQLPAEVIAVVDTPSGVDVRIRLSWGEVMTVRITRRSLEELNVDTGRHVWALFKPAAVTFVSEDALPDLLHGRITSRDDANGEMFITTDSGEIIVAPLSGGAVLSEERVTFRVDPSRILLAV